jgi:acyl carrier protein
MDANNYIEAIITHAAKVFGVNKDSLHRGSTWVDDLHIDVAKSLQDRNFVDFKAALEEEFEVDIPNLKFGKTKTIQEMAEFIADLCEE